MRPTGASEFDWFDEAAAEFIDNAPTAPIWRADPEDEDPPSDDPARPDECS